MTGDKPDERLRTPMQWSRGPAAGFTRGTPWESLQPDSLTANVETQDADPNSLLQVYRRLIRLRAANSTLGSGALVPLATSHDAAVAYLRIEGDHAVLVVANLDTAALAAMTLSSPERVLPAGRYTPKALLGSPPAASLHVGPDGRIQGYVPLRSLAPLTSYLFELAGLSGEDR